MNHFSIMYILLRDYNISALAYALLWTVIMTLIIILKPCLFIVVETAFSYYYVMSCLLQVFNNSKIFMTIIISFSL